MYMKKAKPDAIETLTINRIGQTHFFKEKLENNSLLALKYAQIGKYQPFQKLLLLSAIN